MALHRPRLLTKRSVKLIDWCGIIAVIELALIASYCQCRVRHSGQVDDDDNKHAVNKRLVISKQRDLSDHFQTYESSCSAFANCDELLNSKCSAIRQQDEDVLQGQLRSKLGGVTNNSDIWCSCEKRACSIVYKVDRATTKISEVLVRGLADRKANIIISAQYFSDPDETFQLAKLRGETYDHEVLTDVEYKYSYDAGYLDVAMLNVTMELNGGFSVIQNFTIVLQNRHQKRHNHKRIEQNHVLDQIEQMNKYWFESDCAYGEYVEDSWNFGCGIDGDFKNASTSTGFWFPCQGEACSLFFDGTKIDPIRTVVATGFFQDGEIRLLGKSHLTDEWDVLMTQTFVSEQVHRVVFDLSPDPTAKVLQLEVISNPGGVMAVDKATVHTGKADPITENSHITHPTTTRSTTVKTQVSSSSPNAFNSITLMIVLTTAQIIMFNFL